MRTHTSDRNRPDRSAETPAHIVAALADHDAAYRNAADLPHTTDAERATRADRLALVVARRAAWWGVLSTWTYLHSDKGAVYGRAAMIARAAEWDRARFWRDTAADWRARAERRPTSDAAGALSNWHELGVSA
ncbi:hypothetical protein I4I73_17310 [Pseudonocardia sp. KRD-184]|uniref:DUF3291 domain-containing protein n=1 Tax=Pseudonocardia oceani TaxID=2792013 RepID=A0ABS6U771_9PSEU|nr:hypothetical protein [Pseudonocardia oceani]MBW0090621.1 hypothetical protein [Pseudonocardia oceani]MBW0097741.1 hypothetical protein [Pseudonocardia oceani]MBW0110322.1 hypothetical protein [Pseudonocardia oceani]MBW0120850.1 hypothetical protein [Pseudonocardia oceani]MBW0128061.1 hypothetical protein [Pseudonocardia oceani]